MSTDTLTDLLNKVSAMVKCGASTNAEIEKATGIPAKQVSDILNLRRARPNGERALALQHFAAGMQMPLSKGSRKLQTAYRREYRALSRRFPSTGKKD